MTFNRLYLCYFFTKSYVGPLARIVLFPIPVPQRMEAIYTNYKSFCLTRPLESNPGSHVPQGGLSTPETPQAVDNGCLFLSPLTTIVPHANSLDPDETSSNSASHPNLSCQTLRQYFHHFFLFFFLPPPPMGILALSLIMPYFIWWTFTSADSPLHVVHDFDLAETMPGHIAPTQECTYL